MTTKRKPAIRVQKIVHTCTQEENLRRQEENSKRHAELLERLGIVTLGNGHPEDGLLFMFRAFLERDKQRVLDLERIDKKLDDAIKANATTRNALNIYKAETEGIKKGSENANKDQNTKTGFTFQTAMLVVAIIVFLTNLFFQLKTFNLSQKTNDTSVTTNKNVENLGTPVIVNDRSGKIVNLPDGFSLKYYGNYGFKNFKDTAK